MVVCRYLLLGECAVVYHVVYAVVESCHSYPQPRVAILKVEIEEVVGLGLEGSIVDSVAS